MEENNILLLILNPAAGTRYARRLLPEIIAMFTNYGHACLTFVTEQRGDATRFVEQYGDRAGKIVCIGGDGTFNETITGLLRAGLRVPVGYIRRAARTILPTACICRRIFSRLRAISLRASRSRSMRAGSANGILLTSPRSARLPAPPTKRRRT